MLFQDELFDHLDVKTLETLSPRRRVVHEMPPHAVRVELFQEGRYAAYAYDLEFGWRWVITRDGEEIQEGSALSRESALRSSRHVLAFFTRIERHEAA